ncbi:hypothetical protein EMCRGX_G011941 [Ephydatia muelleri]
MASTASLDSTKQKASSKYKRPRVIGRTSDVDETLFGPPARMQQMSGNRRWSSGNSFERPVGGSAVASDPYRTGNAPTTNRKVIQVITNDLIRKLKVPSTPDPSGVSVILDSSELERIERNAQVLSPEKRKQLEESLQHKKNEKLEASLARKKEMQQLEDLRKEQQKPSDLEQEAIEQSEQLVTNAKMKVMEQDDEIKKLNEYILNAKCHAIRDVQLQEKKEIDVAMSSEEDRLDTMMEIDRVKAIQEYEQRENERQLQRLKGAEVIQKQILEREQQRLLEAERREQETQAMLQYLERLQVEDLESMQKKKETQKKLMEEVSKCNEEIKRQKLAVKEQEKLIDMKVLDYIKEKQHRDEEQQKEMERQKAEKEKEIARLRAQQERAKDKQAERDALKAKRRQEEFEREWRRKEKEEAEKKAETNTSLCEAREQQVHTKEHFFAVQAQRDREEFERVLRIQQQEMAQEQEKQSRAAANRRQHAQEIRKQVRKQEESKIANRRAFFEEGIKLDQEAKERRRKLDEIKQKKLAELKAAGIPDKYCAEVSRRITAPPASFAMAQLH